LSSDLNRLPIIPPDQRSASFRNPNGVALKIANLRYFDSSTTSVGMRAGSRLDGEIYAEFGENVSALEAEVRAIRFRFREWLEPDSRPYGEPTPIREQTRPAMAAEDRPPWNASFEPFALHLTLENDMEAQEEHLQSAHPRVCAICGFDFGRTYGDLGAGYIQFHHRVPLTEVSAGYKPAAADLVPICANCHVMLHQRESNLTIDELRVAIRDTQKANLRELVDRYRLPSE